VHVLGVVLEVLSRKDVILDSRFVRFRHGWGDVHVSDATTEMYVYPTRLALTDGVVSDSKV
jgi:hypothetical protein